MTPREADDLCLLLGGVFKFGKRARRLANGTVKLATKPEIVIDRPHGWTVNGQAAASKAEMIGRVVELVVQG